MEMFTRPTEAILATALAQQIHIAHKQTLINCRQTAQQTKHALAELATMLTLPAILTLIVAPTDS